MNTDDLAGLDIDEIFRSIWSTPSSFKMNNQQSITYIRLSKQGYQFEYNHADLVVMSKNYERVAIRTDGTHYVL